MCKPSWISDAVPSPEFYEHLHMQLSIHTRHGVLTAVARVAIVLPVRLLSESITP